MSAKLSDAISLFAVIFGITSLAGLASLLRSGQKITFVSTLSALLNGGVLGLGIALLWYTKFEDNIYFLIGICVLAGLGGATMIDFVLSLLKNYFAGNARHD